MFFQVMKVAIHTAVEHVSHRSTQLRIVELNNTEFCLFCLLSYSAYSAVHVLCISYMICGI